MAITIATGTQIAMASSYGPSVAMSVLTNATEAVATLATGHATVVGDFLEVTSGWDLLTGKLVRAKTVVGDVVTLELTNTLSTSAYPVGSGTGSVRRITVWTNITQIQSIDTSGGDLNFADITTIADRTQKQIPTTRGAQQITLNFFDDPLLSWYAPAVAASDSVIATGFRIIFPTGSRLVANGYFSLQKTPTVAINAPLTAALGFSAVADPVRYPT